MPLTQAQVWTFFWLHIGVILVVTSYYTLAAAIWPNMAARAAIRFGQRWWLTLLIGLLVSIPVVLVSILLATAGPVQAIGVIGLMAWFLLGLVGGSGMALHVGRHGQPEMPPAKAAMRGGLLIGFSWALPLIGWLFVLPLTIAMGVGCLILGWMPIRPPHAHVPQQPTQPGGGHDEQGFAYAQREEMP